MSDNRAQEILARNDQLKGERSIFDTIWQSLSYYVQPGKDNVVQQASPSVDQNTWLFDTTAIQANEVMAAGVLAQVTPSSEQWCGYEYPATLKARQPNGQAPDAAAKWFAQCTEIAMREIAQSNFYTEAHEAYRDRGGRGTGALYVQEGKRTALNFTCLTLGSYCIAEDDEGMVDTLYREFPMSARQMKQKFGEKDLGENVRKALENPQTMDKKFTIVHAIYPRSDDERDSNKRDGKNKRFASCYVCKEDTKVIRESGYDDFPTMVSRHENWNNEVYGYCPSIAIFGLIKQVNFIEKQMDALAEKTAFPPVLIPESMEGAVDLRAAGVTMFDPNTPNAMPKEWATMGRYDIGLQRVEQKQQAIKDAYHNDIFQMFAQAERQMTAYEAMQRAAEKLILFSPTLSRLVTDLTSLMQSIFGILYRGGYFPEAPAEAFAPNARGEFEVAMPQVTFTSKIVLAVKAIENRSMMELMGILGPLLQIKPEIIDNFDLDALARLAARNLSLPTLVLRSSEAVAAERQARAEQMAAQQQLANAEVMSKTLKNVGETPADVRDQAGAAIDI